MTNSPKWMTVILYLAGIYNIIWGTVVVLFPTSLFIAAGMQEPRYPELFQCIGMMIAVFGIAYIAAASDPIRHWPIILAGLIGRILGPIGFAYGAINGSFSWLAGVTIITNDLIWLIPFAIMLWSALKYERNKTIPTTV